MKMCCKVDIYFWRQSFILLSGVLFSLGVGFMLAFPAVLSPALVADGTDDIRATRDVASWIAASNGIAGVIGFIIQSPIMQIFGRKASYIVLNAALVIGWIIFIFATNVAALFAARIIQGICVGGLFINAIVVSEYCHPKRRGYFMSLKKAAQSIGALICHVMSSNFTWRQVSIIAIAPPALAIVTTLFWPESPSFYVMKGRYQECEKSFYWLNGKSEESEKELLSMIEAQKERLEQKNVEPKSSRFYKVLNMITKKDFLKAFLVVSVLTLVIDAAGKYYLVAYVVEILKQATGDKGEAIWYTLGADCLTIAALFLSCFVIKSLKRRTVLFAFGSLSVLLMFTISAISVILAFQYKIAPWIMCAFVLLHAFVVNVSIIPVCYVFFGELFPLEHRTVGFCASGIVLTCFYAVTMKLTPFLMLQTGLEGTYGAYGCFLVICFIVLFFTVPETKDRTLQEIEDEMKGIKRRREIIQLDKTPVST